MRAFDAGWGGAVWKTIGEPIVNVSSRYSSVDWNGQRMMGLNNIELITDRPIETNLREITEVKKRYPNHAVIASLMVESKREVWHDIVKRSEDAGADGLELNFGCPHGMSERGMGSAVGQVPEYACMITEWVKEVARTPVIVKLTPNITDIRMAARAAPQRPRRRRLRHQHHQLHHRHRSRHVRAAAQCRRASPRTAATAGRRSSRSRSTWCSRSRRDPEVGIPISGIGGISGWRDAAEFILLGCGTVQVCTAAMHYGFRIVEDMIDGLSNWMDEKGFRTIEDFRGRSVPKVTEWKHLDLNYKIVAASIATTVHRLRALLHRLLGWRAPVHRSVHRGRERQEKSERHGRARSTHHRGRVRGLQSMRARLPRRSVHHHEGNRYRPAV